MQQTDLFLPRPVQIALDNAKMFPDDFLEWLPANIHIFEAFAHEAKKIIAKGFTHYSSYTIVEFLRHHTALQEYGSKEDIKEWKINNNHRPYLARLFDLVFPAKAGLFEYRITKKVHTPEAMITDSPIH